MIKKTYLTHSFGCKVNTYEIEAVEEYLAQRGFVSSEDPEYIIINTCAVTSTSERKCLTKVRSLASTYKDAKILVLGCSSQLHKERYLAIDNVKVVSGNSGKLLALNELISGANKRDLVKDSVRFENYEEELCIAHFKEESRAFLKIQDGCDNFCSYCVIPTVRGNSRSRNHMSIILEARRLFNNNYKEIVLTGIDMGHYLDPKDDSYGLYELLVDLLKEVKDGRRLRISSLETSQIDTRIVDLFLNYKSKLATHLHIPLQSGSKSVLKRMNRLYDLDHFLDLARAIKEKLPDIGLSTDVIVGFPGEDEASFAETYQFIKEVGFMRLHVFPYSPRPATLAASYKDQIDGATKKTRVHELIKLGKRLESEFIKRLEGKRIMVLFESLIVKNNRSYYKGYSENYLEVEIESDEDLIGELKEVLVTKEGYRLV